MENYTYTNTATLTLSELHDTCEKNKGKCTKCIYSIFCECNKFDQPRDWWLPRDLEKEILNILNTCK